MAKKNILVDIDFNQNQLLNPVLQNLPEDPSTGVEGQKYFNTTNHIERTYRNGAWQNTTDEYELPAASTNTRGGIKVGSRLYIENEDVLNVHRASKVIEGIGRFATDAEVEAGTQPNVAIDPVQLKSVIDGLPTPMQFKGTLGSGGTITVLPTASSSNIGFLYLVISDGTYDGQSAKAGDEFISNGTNWILIPSGDEPAQIQADWNQSDNTALDYIKNKPDVALKTDVEDLQEDVEELQNGYFIPGWRTPTSAEWNYIINTRSASTIGITANARYIKAQVNGINGLILLPDIFILPSGISIANINSSGAAYTGNTYTVAQLETLEDAGCVFLPCTGYRVVTTINSATTCCDYWASTNRNATQTYGIWVTDIAVSASNINEKYGGSAVRVIKNNPNGSFSFSANTKGDIAKSNLQFHCLNKKWRFAPNSYDAIGTANSNIAENYNGWIDLFAWGTSGWNSGANAYQPWSTSNNNSDYLTQSITDDYKNADWGVFATNKQLQDVAFSGSYNDLTDVPDATETQKGVVELATDAETKAGTDTGRVITPHGLASVLPMPTAADADKLLSVNSSGEYELITIINSELIPY